MCVYVFCFGLQDDDSVHDSIVFCKPRVKLVWCKNHLVQLLFGVKVAWCKMSLV